MIVLSSPVPGREQEYNDWYQNVHLRDVLTIEGVKSARRYKSCLVVTQSTQHPYLAIYDIETDDIEQEVASLLRKVEREEMVLSDALDRDTFTVVYEEFGPLVTE
jgi:hypothetical protein